MTRREFHPLQAEAIARAFNDAGVEYLFLGKSGAILLGYPGTTQDVDVFPARKTESGRRLAGALNPQASSVTLSLCANDLSNPSFPSRPVSRKPTGKSASFGTRELRTNASGTSNTSGN